MLLRFKNFFTRHNILLLGLLLIFVFLLFYGFPDSPAPWFDEGLNSGIAKSWSQHGVFSLQIGPNEFVQERSLLITTNYPLLFFTALSFKIFGVGLWQARAVMLIFLFIFALLFYQLVKKYYGQNYALMSLALVITFLPFYGNGKSVLGEIPGLVYFLAGLLLFDKKRNEQVFLTGLFFGLGAATKSLYLLFIISVLAGEVWVAVRERKLDYRRWLWLISGMTLPILLWLYTLIPERFSLDYLVKTFILYSNPYKAEGTAILNLFRFVSETTPLHFTLLFLTSVFAKITARSRALTKLEIVLLIFIILDVVFFLRTVGWYRYFFPAHILLFILFPAALAQIIENFSIGGWLKAYGPATVTAALVAVQSVHLFINIQKSLYYNPNLRLFSTLVNQKIPADKDVLVVANPEAAFLLTSENVYQYVRANPHVVFGKDLFKAGRYPSYLISNAWSDNAYLSDYLSVMAKYDLILTGEKYNLYAWR